MWSSEYHEAIFLNNMGILRYLVYWFFKVLVSSHKIYFSQVYLFIFIFLFFLFFLNSNVFSSFYDKNFEKDEKNSCIFDELITLEHDPSIGVIANIIGNIKFIFLFLETFFEKILFGLLFSCLVLSHSA